MKQLQREEEMAWFAALLAREGVRSYLEIGSKFGGSLEQAAKALPAGSRIVSVDLPNGAAETRPHLQACVASLRGAGYDSHLILGDSTAPEIIASAAALGPYDACFIDANHTLPYVTKDWENYGPMARIVAFHDIAFVQKPEGRYKGIEVPQFWESIKGGYRHEECKLDGPHNGIGVLWRST
jgi:predicted O-methyltransferase YrrM